MTLFREKEYQLSKVSREKAKEHKKWDKAEPIAQGYNTHCRYFEKTGGEINCRIKMETWMCGVNCPYATTNGELASTPYTAPTTIYHSRRKGK